MFFLCRIPLEAKTTIRNFRYKRSGLSLVEPYLDPVWDVMVTYLPLTWAPNFISVLGLVCSILPNFVLVYFDGYRDDIPPLVYVTSAVGLIVYQTLDVLDGAQSRRLGIETHDENGYSIGAPVEDALIDHGFDTYSGVAITVTMCIGLNLRSDPLCILVSIAVTSSLFYITHWRMGLDRMKVIEGFDVHEAPLACAVGLIGAAIFGRQMWEIVVPLVGIRLKILLIIVLGITAVARCIKLMSVIVGIEVEDSVRRRWRPAIPLLTFVLAVCMYVTSSRGLDVLHRYPYLTTLTLVLMVIKIIHNQLLINMICTDAVPVFDLVFIPYYLLILLPLTYTAGMDEVIRVGFVLVVAATYTFTSHAFNVIHASALIEWPVFHIRKDHQLPEALKGKLH